MAMSIIDVLSSGLTRPAMAFPNISTTRPRMEPVIVSSTDSQQDLEADVGTPQISSNENLAELLQLVGEKVDGFNPATSELSIGVDKEADRIVVKLVNSETKEVIRQIPPEEMLRLAERMRELEKTILDERA
jgi:flagellar protein FlaG